MPSTPSAAHRIQALAALVALAAAVIFGVAWASPPAPVGLDAPATEFSSARARVHLEAIAQRPHRMGSPDHARVRAYLLAQLQALGLSPEVQEVVSAQTRHRPARIATVKNVVARRPGTGSGQALLLMAHYDSRSMTPGASDDGYGVAALLETARALQAGGPLASDVIFLFTDGEEEGLLGAHAFVGGHPWAARVGLVLNFDARGDAGPVLMYQTGDDNGALIRELGRAVARPRASSVSAAVYRRMPNDSDLSEWLPRTPSLNFANIGGFERYHAPTDTVGNVDEGTLQQDGAYALSLSRAFAARALPLPREPDRVFFNVGPFFVHYPGAWDLPFALAAALLVFAFVVVGHRRGAVRAPFAALGLLAVLAMVLLSALASGLLWALAARLHPDYRLLNAASPGLKGLYLASFVASAVALVLAAQGFVLRRLRPAELLAGSAAVLAVVALLAASWLPGAACLFAWPVLAAAPFVAALLFGGPFDRDTPGGVALAIAAGVPPLVLVGPLVPQLFTAFGPDVAPVLGAVTALLVTFVTPAARLVLRAAPRLAPLLAAAVAVACYLAGNLAQPFDGTHPRPDTVFYAFDADRGDGFWVTPDPRPPPWAGVALVQATRGPVPVPFPLAGDVFATPAIAPAEPAPEITWLADAPQGSGRSLRLRVVPPTGSELLAVDVEHVRSARVAGTSVPIEGGRLAFRFYAPPAAGVEIELATDSPAPVRVRVASQRAGFPAGTSPGVRPADRMAKPGMLPPYDRLLESDMTIVARSSQR